MFVDRVQIEVQGGAGGNGCMSFRRERFVPRGGPDGGDGGQGGSVIVVAEAGVDQLAALVHRKHWRAEAGTAGGSSNRTGRRGKDLVIQVPPGTIIVDPQTGDVMKDLATPGDQVTVARGGRGGKGNLSFTSPTNLTSRTTTAGGEGEERRLLLELKVIADVGLLGKPNAGKSTLLSRLSRARPEVAPYPFTTKQPHLGIVRVDFDRTFVMADIPGLIEGAHSGIGLGHEFLRHLERAGILVHLVEPQPMDGSDPILNYHAIRQELALHSADLAERPEIVVVSKQDLPEGEQVRQLLEADLGREVLGISAASGVGLNQLIGSIARALDERQAASGARS